MKLSKINYNSAVVFGVFTLFMYLAIGALQWALRDVLSANGIQIQALQTFVVAPLAAGIIGYLTVLAMIVIYNYVALKFPISWEISKK